MTKKVKAKYENGTLRLDQTLDIKNGTSVDVIILTLDNNDDIETKDIMSLSLRNEALDFLNDPEEDGYTLDDLKVRYK